MGVNQEVEIWGSMFVQGMLGGGLREVLLYLFEITVNMYRKMTELVDTLQSGGAK